MVCPKKSILSSPTFKKYLASSLPYTWDEFTCQFTCDPTKINYTVPQFIGDCHKEYCHCLKHGDTLKVGDTTYVAIQLSLAKHIGNDAQKLKPKTPKSKCTHCGRCNHKVEDCYHASKPKCMSCKKLGHTSEQCCLKKTSQNPQKGKEQLIANTLSNKKETHIAKVDSDKEALTAMQAKDSSIYLDQYETGSNPNYDVYLASLASNDDNSRMYVWLADSALTNYIACQHELFSLYEQTPDTTIHRIGGKIIQVEGHRTVSLKAQCRVHTCILHLQNIKYIPLNKYNIFALGRWDSQG